MSVAGVEKENTAVSHDKNLSMQYANSLTSTFAVRCLPFPDGAKDKDNTS